VGGTIRRVTSLGISEDGRRPATRRVAALAALTLTLAGCRTMDRGASVWVDTLPVEPPEAPYLIGPGDLLAVRVYNQDAFSATVRVRRDGMVTLPFLNDVEVAGQAPTQVAHRLQTRLTEFLVNPVVTVSLQEARPLEVSVLGEVQKAGLYRLEPGAGVLTALAAASGLGQFADRDRIFVVRNGTQRIRFTYAALCQASERAALFKLRPGDVVVVE
jgi:polysaccharide biosynthesis/export protein